MFLFKIKSGLFEHSDAWTDFHGFLLLSPFRIAEFLKVKHFAENNVFRWVW